jgi:hypothetical protein
MSYAIEVLTKENDLILKALKETKAWGNYPEAYKRQMKKSNELIEAINKLTK